MNLPSRRGLLPLLLTLGATVFTANVGAATDAASAHPGQPDECRQVTARFREHLEAVTEACIDGRLADLGVASTRAGLWWASRPSPWPTYAGSDSLLRVMRSAAERRDSSRAALAAAKLSIESFGWCGGPSGTMDDLMVLDLAGTAGWLRAHGQSLDWPPGLEAVTSRVRAALARKGRKDLGVRLEKAMADLLAIPDRSKSGSRAAVAALDLVDVLERALR